MPDISSLPPGSFGEGPARFTFPLGNRGALGSRTFGHCAIKGAERKAINAAATVHCANGAIQDFRCMETILRHYRFHQRAAQALLVAASRFVATQFTIDQSRPREPASVRVTSPNKA